MGDLLSGSPSDIPPHALLERGFQEAVRRSANCPHSCRSFMVTLILDAENPFKAGFRGCALSWFIQEYPAHRSTLLFKTPILATSPEVPLCPFCGNSSLHLEGSEDEDGVTFVVSCRRCDSTGPIVDKDESHAIKAWSLRTSTPQDWLAASVRGQDFKHPLPPDESGLLRECPFCGQKRLHVSSLEHGEPFLVSCDTCEAAGPSSEDREAAIGGWNRRV